MRTSFSAFIAGAALVAAGVGGPAGTAKAEPLDWGMELAAYNTSWSSLLTTNFLGCADLPIRIRVWVPAESTAWEVSGEITGAGSPVVLAEFAFSSSGQTTGLDGVSIPGVKMCSHFEGPVTPPNHEYVVTATGTVTSSPTPTMPLTDQFTIDPLNSWGYANVHEGGGGVSTLKGVVVVSTQDGFSRPAPSATVTVERLEGATWLTVGTALPSAADGRFAVTADRLLPAGTYVRVLYDGTYWVRSQVGMPQQLPAAWTPPPPLSSTPPPGMIVSPPPPVTVVQPTPKVKATAVSSRSKLKVDVNPNMGRKYWTFQVQKQLADGTWKALKTYRTLGSSEKRTVNLPKGTYRVWVNPKFGYQGVMSATVSLKR